MCGCHFFTIVNGRDLHVLLPLTHQNKDNAMQKIRTEIVINATAATVWNILTAFDQYAAWNPFITEISGTLKTGGRLRNTMINNGKKYVFSPKVLRVEPERYFDWKGSLIIPGLFDGHHYFEIEAINDRQVKLSQGENFSGILSGMLLKQIGAATRENFVKMNMAVKQLAEQQ